MARRIAKWLLWGLMGLTGLAVIAAGGGFVWLRGSLPQTEGRIELEPLGAPVTVLRDSHGVVTIRAADEADAMVALGFVHAQDRLWQMDFLRRLGAGRLSEVIGEATLGMDRFMRTLGLYRLSEAQYDNLRPATRATLDAYAAGVNAFLEQRPGPLPLEFHLLRYEPEPWKPADSLVWGRIMALLLSDNWRTEVLRAKLLKRMSPEKVAFLWPTEPESEPTTIPDTATLPANETLQALLDGLPPDLHPQSASNAWAVAGRHTTSGLPILANDPHLGLRAPGQWYLVRIETPGLTLAGATAPGVPFVIIGHNQHIAWGFTTTHSDTQDLFLERLVDGDEATYVTPLGPRAFTVRRERIEVKGQAAVDLEVRSTARGPIISDAFSEATNKPQDGHVMALAWPALRDDDRTPDAMHSLNRADSWAAFLAAMRDFHSPQQNILFADVDGNIGFAAPARVPVRRRGDGFAPVPGWSSDYDWIGTIPFDELPKAFNPQSGRLVSANNRVVPRDYPHFLTGYWPSPQRARRVIELLDGNGRMTAEIAADMQSDSLSRDAVDLLPLLLAVPAEQDEAREASAMLAAWNRRMDRHRPEPLLYAAWTAHLTRRLLADEAGEDFPDLAQPRPRRLIAILTRGQSWCDDVTTPASETCDLQIAAALEDAIKALAERLGGGPSDWRWGDLHRAELAHPVLDRIPVLGGLVGFGLETDGGNETVNRGAYSVSGQRPFSHVVGASLRIVYDLEDLDRTRAITATGQSGNPLSPHYGSLAPLWRDGELIGLRNHDDAGTKRLELLPR